MSQEKDALDLSELKANMMARTFPMLYDDLVPRPSFLLNTTLSDYLQHNSMGKPYRNAQVPLPNGDRLLPPAHHLVYLPPTVPDSLTLPDGTDPNQSPGEPFTRRMWAGGELYFSASMPLHLDGSRVACVERIADVQVKGRPGSEKLFVRMERLIGKYHKEESEDAIRERFGSRKDIAITEVRNIFFSRPLASTDAKSPKLIKPSNDPEFTHTLVPNAKLLFRYSALTFNTHAIHRDIEFCRNIEHYPGLIVHGPLSLTLLTTFLRHHLAQEYPGNGYVIQDVKYRNTHPLYSEQPLKLCGRQIGHDHYEMWEETSEGNVAVQLTATVQKRAISAGQEEKFEDEIEYGLC